MKNVIILHGSSSKPTDFWFPYIKENIEKVGYQVWVPELPDTDTPELKHQLRFVLEGGNFNQDTILIGHSSGCPLILAVLEKLPSRISKSVQVAGFLDGEHSILKKEYDWERIKSNAKDFLFINSDNDPWGCDHKQGLRLFEKLGGTLVIRHGEGHMGSEKFNQPYKEFPLLLKLLEV